MIMTMRLLGGRKAIKNARPKKQNQKKNIYLLFGIHQDGGIGVFLKTRKKNQKVCFWPPDMLRLRMY